MSTTDVRTIDSLKTDETRQIERTLRRHFPNTAAYRFNSASIRIRIIDECFAGKSNPEREELVEPHLLELREETQAHIMVLLLLTPSEAKSSLMNLEFESPQPSRL